MDTEHRPSERGVAGGPWIRVADVGYPGEDAPHQEEIIIYNEEGSVQRTDIVDVVQTLNCPAQTLTVVSVPGHGQA